MNEGMEIEYKILLNEDLYNQISEDYKPYLIKKYKQTNYYLTHPLLSEKYYMLRIREKDDFFELTLKRPVNNHRLETNITINEELKNKILNHEIVHNEIFDLLEKEGIPQSELENKYSLTTIRSDHKLAYGILSLDYNEYLGITDYELEYEVNDEEKGFNHFLEIIEPYHLSYTSNCDSKITRVFNQLKSRS